MTKQSAYPGGGFLLTGATGVIGKSLAQELASRKIHVIQAVRQGQAVGSGGAEPAAPSLPELLPWDPRARQAFSSTSPLEGLRAVVHLSGANVAGKRWSPAYKREILNSRTETTAAIARTLASLEHPPEVLLTASAIGIYGNRGDEVLTETSSTGTDFLAETCKAWEAAAAPALEAGIRVVHLRFGVVLTLAGGALAKVLPLFRAGLGGRLGDGHQWMSWITLDDAVGAVLHAAGLGAERADKQPDDAAFARGSGCEGAVNCVSPHPVTNATYTRELAAILHRPAFATAPAFALRLAVGEMADAALLSSCRALPGKLVESGYRFRFPELGPALSHLLRT